MIVQESFSVDTGRRDFIGIEHVQIWNTSVDMGGRLWFERRNLGWVVATLDASLRIYAFPPAALANGADSIRIFESGPEQSPYTNLVNRRPKASPHGGVYALAFGRDTAQRLVAALHALRKR